MTQENYNKATDLLEQISKIKVHKKHIQSKYDGAKNEDLKKFLTTCNDLSTALLEIKELRLKEL
jgi:hypothetical protein